MIDFRTAVPLFPLQNCVLLPHATVPLHMFESRYRAMVEAVLDGPGLIATAVFEGDDWKTGYAGDPPLRRAVCVGALLKHQRLSDGRFNILLHGVCRASILEEVERGDGGYRMAVLEPLEREGAMEIDLVEQREELESMLADPYLQQLTSVRAISNWMNDEVPTDALVDLATLAVCHAVEGRYGVLSEPEVVERAHWLLRYLKGTRRTLKIAEGLGPAVSEEGWPLN